MACAFTCASSLQGRGLAAPTSGARFAADARCVRAAVGRRARVVAASATSAGDGRLVLVAAGASAPHPDKVQSGGEDACMVYVDEVSRVCAMGVADGVSGWVDKGVDAAAYSKVLVTEAYDAYASGDAAMSPQAAMARAQAAATVPGSATFVVASMRDGTTLDVANVGDAGVRVVRQGRVVLASEPQQHQFDMPYQLACDAFVTAKFDSAADADVLTCECKEGDWVLLASDGLFDNLFDEELVQSVMTAGESVSEPFAAADAVAKALVRSAQQRSADKKAATPYAVALAAAKEERAQFKTPAFMRGKATGGKLDDITVVAAKVVARSDGAVAASLAAAAAAAAGAVSDSRAVAVKAVAANAETFVKEQRIRDRIAARELQFQQSLEAEE